jgi:hypothetical protein
MHSNRILAWIMTAALLITMANPGVSQPRTDRQGVPSTSDQIAESYVKLVLAVGQHDDNYVDAYYGPDAWQAEAKAHKTPLGAIRALAAKLVKQLARLRVPRSDEMRVLRHQYLAKQLHALIVRVDMLRGKKLLFDDESKGLYDAVAPSYPERHFQQLLDSLETVLPGEGSLQQRYERFRNQFIIPKEKLDTVFSAAIDECRRRTKSHIQLPANESFNIEYVTGKSWGAYNWYKGNSHSLIQVNTDLPIYIGNAVGLAAHEGYPGHHVYNVLLEENMLKTRHWIEFSIYPLFSPQSLIAEGSANYGIEVAFPGNEKLQFERDRLYPLAGLDPSKAEIYNNVTRLVEKLSYAGNEAARRYLNGQMNREAAILWHMKYGLATRERAEKSLRFIEQYRSYVINYNLGEDLVKRYIESRGGGAVNAGKNWVEFARLLSSPRVPSGLR